VRVGASDVAVAVRVRRDGMLLKAVAPQVAASALTVDQALDQFVRATALAPRAGRRRKGPGSTKSSARSDFGRAHILGCWWIFTDEQALAGFRLGSLQVADLRPDHLERVLLDQASQGKPASTQNKYRQFLAGFTKWVATKGMVSRPMVLDTELTRRNTEARRTRRLSGEEERAGLLKVCGPWLRTVVEAALETGCRLGELLGMTWAMVDLDKRRIALPASLTKSSAARIVPISPRLLAVLRMRQTDPDGKELPPTSHVFGNEIGQPVKSLKTAWKTACRRAGITGLHFHDLRRESASRLLEAGLPLHFVSKSLGHANISTTSTYLAASDQDLQRAFDALDHAPGRQPAPGSKRESQPAAAVVN
jgi:integrase